nr:transposase [Oceanospirillum sanctuarii]
MGYSVPTGDQVLAEQVGDLSVYFKYPEQVRKAIYTTNAFEAMHRQFRKLTKTKGGLANENALLKLLYTGTLRHQSDGRIRCKTGT